MRIVLALAMVVMATGCPDDDGDGSNYVAINQIKSAYQDAYCQYLVRCGQFPDQAACVGANLSSSFSLDPNIVASVLAGKTIYNGGAVKACFAALAQRSCDKTSASARSVPLACRDFLRGTLGAGQACLLDEECVSQQCVGSQPDISCAMGSCLGDTPPAIQLAAIGEQCTTTEGCVEGAYCDTSLLRCAALLDSGMPCTNNGECNYGLGCGGATGARTCKLLPTEGEPCPDFLCREDGQYCNPNGVCAKVGLPPATCTSNAECSLYYPCDFTTSTGMCKQGPGLDQSCSGTNRCFAVGTFCDSSTFMCVAVRPIGGACSNDTQCESEFCDFDAGMCAAPQTCF
ncbi:MAG TPA: Dickkopf N-terminal cysteine-rich domain-containing protein [Kofleriaceae bacterium]|nr:Dickkopf N-terminal cysteine-rich domain-containing protein [Kofleriaceae bacterium]